MKKLRINIEGKIKICLSLMLFFYAFIIGIIINNITIIFAMFFSVIGDILLLFNRGCFNEEKKETFNYGILAFAMSHIVYMYAMMTGILSNIFICIALGFIVILSILIKDKKEPRIIVFLLYAIIILLNFLNSVNFNLIAAIGMVIFMLSDIAIAVSKVLKKRTRASQIFIWVTYIFAQVCMVTSFLLL